MLFASPVSPDSMSKNSVEAKMNNWGNWFFQTILTVMLSVGITIIGGFYYLNNILRPWDVLTIDYRLLSQAKLIELTRQSASGKKVTPEQLNTFLDILHHKIDEYADGRLVFLSGSVLNASGDMTELIAHEMGININETSLPAMKEAQKFIHNSLKERVE